MRGQIGTLNLCSFKASSQYSDKYIAGAINLEVLLHRHTQIKAKHIHQYQVPNDKRAFYPLK